MRRATSAAVVGAVSLLALAGCSADHKSNDAAEVGKTARVYQAAVNRLDWRHACELRTPSLRHGTVAKCAASNVGPEKSPKPTSSPSTSDGSSAAPPTGEPTAPTYGDGRTLPPPATRSASPGPDRARTGPVKTGKPVKVGASADHPAGYGVTVTYSVKWPGKDATTSREALRLVKIDGAWRIDQHEDIQQGDYQTGDALQAALSK
jgi:hypothetical protein